MITRVTCVDALVVVAGADRGANGRGIVQPGDSRSRLVTAGGASLAAIHPRRRESPVYLLPATSRLSATRRLEETRVLAGKILTRRKFVRKKRKMPDAKIRNARRNVNPGENRMKIIIGVLTRLDAPSGVLQDTAS